MLLTPNKQWNIPFRKEELQVQLGRQLGVSPLLAQLLINRGLQDVSSASGFLWGTLADLHSPFSLKGMQAAGELILSAIEQGRKICVYGDYDVDGITGAVLLYRVLHGLRADVMVYLPNRLEEGYGLNCQALEGLKREGVELVITVDCGVASCQEVAFAQRLGMQVIISDHHQLAERLPEAAAILNPKQPGCSYPCKQLAGVGVALKLAQGLLCQAGRLRAAADLIHQELDLVALGTVADVVPLQGENRILVKYGLKQLTNSSKSGIKALKEIVGFEKERPVTVSDVAFRLVPRLNAAGRLGDPRQSFQLLASQDDCASKQLACQVDEKNRQRQVIGEQILTEARRQLRQTGGEDLPPVIVLAAADWHVGVIGIVASRLVEEFFRPTVIIALQEGMGRGSARSVRNFHLQQALNQCQDLLLKFGGHEQAAGLSIQEENIPALRDRINQLADQVLQEDDLIPEFFTDGEIVLDDLNISLYQEFQQLAPFGMGNPAPVFCARQVQIVSYPRTVGNNHLKLKLRQGKRVFDGIGFKMGQLSSRLAGRGESPFDIVFRPQLNFWQGEGQVQLCLEDLAESGS